MNGTKSRSKTIPPTELQYSQLYCNFNEFILHTKVTHFVIIMLYKEAYLYNSYMTCD